MGFSRQEYWSGVPLPSQLAAAAAAKSLQSCLTLCDSIDDSPPDSSLPGILQARTLEWIAISFSNALKWKLEVKLLSCVQLLATPWTAVHQAPPPMGFSRQEYWSWVPLPSPAKFIYFLPFAKIRGISVWSENTFENFREETQCTFHRKILPQLIRQVHCVSPTLSMSYQMLLHTKLQS